jgi:ATP-dependent helicase/DNAse subunit B
MTTTLLLSPAATGKTQQCITRVRAALAAAPLTPVWVIVPDRNQGASFKRRLAEAGGVLGARVVVLADLYAELAVLGGAPRPVASDPIVARLTRRAIDAVAERGALRYYAQIYTLPGFARALVDLIAEWKRATVRPTQLEAAVQARGQRLKELAAIYAQYEQTLGAMDWTDAGGQAWQAAAALRANPALAADWQLLVVDGFDSFFPVILDVLALLAGRAKETLITLTGDLAMARPAYRRFARTLKQLQGALAFEIETPVPNTLAMPELTHLRASLFELDAAPQAGSAVQFLEARTPALEAREALRWLKERIVRDRLRPDQCAVIARDLRSYRPYLREAATEFGLPLRFLGSEPLANSALVNALLAALRLPLQAWPRRALLDALRAPYFDLSVCGLETSDAALFDEAAYAGQIISGLEAWETLLSGLAQTEPLAASDDEDETAAVQLPVGQEAQRLLDGLRAFCAKLGPPPDGPLQTHAEWIEKRIFGEEGLGIARQLAATGAAAYADHEALKQLVVVLRGLVSMETALGQRPSINYAQFLSELQTVVEGADYQPDPPESRKQPRIYAGNMNTTRGVPYEAVAILGLSEGIFPAPLAPDPFMPETEIAMRCEQGLPLEPRLRSDQQTLFYEAVSRAARSLLLTRPYLADDGERWEPSPYWSAARALFTGPPTKQVRDAQPYEMTQAASSGEVVSALLALASLPNGYEPLASSWQAARYGAGVLRARLARAAGGGFDGAAPNLAARLKTRALTQPWSASRLEAYATCPYFFYTSASLGLTLRETPVAGYRPHQLGAMLHAALEAVYRQVGADGSEEQLLAALNVVLQPMLADAPSKFGFNENPLWQIERKQLRDTLTTTLSGLAAEGEGFRTQLIEYNFGFDTAALRIQTETGPIMLRGRIDRIDINDDGGLRVIDYKTGASGLDASDLSEGKRLQLPIYALAAEQAIGKGETVDGFYWPIHKAEPGKLRLATFSCVDADGNVYTGPHGAMELAQAFVRSYVAQIVAGNFIPAAPRGGCPSYCPAKRFCWHYAPGRMP